MFCYALKLTLRLFKASRTILRGLLCRVYTNLAELFLAYEPDWNRGDFEVLQFLVISLERTSWLHDYPIPAISPPICWNQGKNNQAGKINLQRPIIE